MAQSEAAGGGQGRERLAARRAFYECLFVCRGSIGG